MGTGGADEDEEGDDLGDESPSDEGDEVSYDWGPGVGVREGCIYVPFVYVQDSHAEDRDDADDESGDDDAHDDGHVPTVDGREHLSGDNATDDAVSDHQDGIKDGD